ncbi:MAG: sodium:solute symporter [Eubacteriales bacterium]
MTQTIALIALAIFAFILIAIGVLTSKKAKTLDGFLLGGRNIGPWLSALSYGTTYFSAVIFIGYSGKNGWDIGLASLWIGIGNALLGSALAWALLARRTRTMTRRINARTMPEFFSERYGDKKMKAYSALVIFIFLVPYAASVYKGLGSLFGSIFPNNILGFSPETVCMFIVALLAAIYLILGGYFATAINNLIQGIIMLGGVTIMCVALVNNPQVGGISAAFEGLKQTDPSLVNIFGGSNISFLLMNIALTSFGTWGLPQMIHKFYAIKDEKSIKIGAIIATVFAAVIGSGAYFAGSLGRFFIDADASGAPVVGYDNVVPTMLIKVFGSSFWGNILLSLILLCVLSASISTLTSVVLTSSSSITVDLASVFKAKWNQRRQMIYTRIVCFLFIAASFIFATFKFSIIVSIMSFSWGVVSGCFIGPYFWGLYSKKTTKAGAWAGLLSGIVVVAAMTVYSILTSPALADGFMPAFSAASANSPLFGTVAMAVSFAVVPIVSLFTKKLPEEITQKAFEK